ncbi:aladin-like [Haliotis cracherodii]|uniref:aladin-like n=1 Tax=Haliotis cracherodii TaxID=6455 RepID=UPI0039E9B09C
MSSILERFPAPPGRGHMTVAEQHGEFVSVPVSDSTGNVGMLPAYPVITVAKELSRNLTQRESAKSAFLPHDETVWKRAMHSWYEHGMTGTFEEVVNSKEEVPPWIASVAMTTLAFLRWANSLNGSLFPHLSLSNEDLISSYTSVADWQCSPVRAFAWHPHTIKVAYALQDDSIRVHTGSNNLMPILKHKLQKNVADLAWQPNSASVLAVACQSCILIWHVEPTSLATRPSASSVQVLHRSGHTPVTSLTWHPDGSILLSAAPTDTGIMAWNVPMEICVTLRRGGGGGVSALRWSPDGTKVLAVTPSPLFRVWETKTWSCETWSRLSSRCVAASWSSDGSILLFAMENDPIIYSIKFSAGQSYGGSDISVSNKAIAVTDVSEVDMQTATGDMVKIGGSVHAMEWDSTGERLAILFRGHDNKAGSYVAVFKTVTHPVIEILPCGLVRGQDSETAHCISFKPKFDQGALLTVVWSSGRVGYVPLLYTQTEGAVPHQAEPLAPLNGQAGMSLHTSFR